MSLSYSDPPLFYALLQANLDRLLPILYTPTGKERKIETTLAVRNHSSLGMAGSVYMHRV